MIVSTLLILALVGLIWIVYNVIADNYYLYGKAISYRMCGIPVYVDNDGGLHFIVDERWHEIIIPGMATKFVINKFIKNGDPIPIMAWDGKSEGSQPLDSSTTKGNQ